MHAEGREVAEAGGLHIIGTERHESRRIDNQLRGRSGRQGDPGSSRFFLALEDDLMRKFAGDWVKNVLTRLGMQEGEAIESKMVSRRIEGAQKKVEERNFDIRKNLLEYDEVMDEQRKRVYSFRQSMLDGRPTKDVLLDLLDEQIDKAVGQFLADDYGAASFAAEAGVRLGVELSARDYKGARLRGRRRAGPPRRRGPGRRPRPRRRRGEPAVRRRALRMELGGARPVGQQPLRHQLQGPRPQGVPLRQGRGRHARSSRPGGHAPGEGPRVDRQGGPRPDRRVPPRRLRPPHPGRLDPPQVRPGHRAGRLVGPLPRPGRFAPPHRDPPALRPQGGRVPGAGRPDAVSRRAHARRPATPRPRGPGRLVQRTLRRLRRSRGAEAAAAVRDRADAQGPGDPALPRLRPLGRAVRADRFGLRRPAASRQARTGARARRRSPSFPPGPARNSAPRRPSRS